MIPTKPVNQMDLDILEAKRSLDNAREEGDTLTIAIFEDALNNLLERYSCNTYHT